MLLLRRVLLTGVESGQARQPEIPSKIEGEQFMRVIVYSREEEPATGLARAIRALVQGVEVDICSSFLQCEETLSLSIGSGLALWDFSAVASMMWPRWWHGCWSGWSMQSPCARLSIARRTRNMCMQ